MFRLSIVCRGLLYILLLASPVASGVEGDSKKLQQQISSTLYRLPLERQGEYALMIY